MSTEPDRPTHGAAEASYEHTDAKVRPLWGAGLLLTVLVVVSFLIGSFLIGAFDDEAAAEDAQREHALETYRSRPAEAVLQAQPQTEMAAYRARIEAELEAYRWVDQPAGIVQVPVERAMELLLERGLPVRDDDGR